MSKAMPPLAALPTAPARARAFIHSELSLWRMDDLAELAELVISEFVTNAVQASTRLRADACAPLIRIGLFADGMRLLVEVWDEADGIPQVRDACEFEESGRGLALVDAICDSWGWKAVPGGHCKCVWAEISN
jgi:anti-sigma regulatory factor (Ser/Thr protein kinase)